jgi:hypothetical protein
MSDGKFRWRPPNLAVEISWRSSWIPTALERSWHFTLQSVAPRIVETARASIITSTEPSPPGQPPHTRGIPGHNIRDAINWKFDPIENDAMLYIDATMVGEIGSVMEYGGYFRGHQYPARPILWPAVEKHLFKYVQQIISGRFRK